AARAEDGDGDRVLVLRGDPDVEVLALSDRDERDEIMCAVRRRHAARSVEALRCAGAREDEGAGTVHLERALARRVRGRSAALLVDLAVAVVVLAVLADL